MKRATALAFRLTIAGASLCVAAQPADAPASNPAPAAAPRELETTTATMSTDKADLAQRGKIIGGQNANPAQWPWIVAIGQGTRDNVKTYCAGTLIAPDWVLTAAHCEIPEEDFVIVGRADLSQTNVGEVLQIAEVRPHKRFDEGKNLATGFHTYDYDVALLRLERAPRTVAQLPLPEDANVIATAMTRGGFRWIAGWGRLGESNPRLPDKLQELKVKIGQDADCIDDYSEIPRPITARMFCAKGRVMSTAGGGQLADACQGDSGGPMISLDKFDKDPVLIGIISKGAGCGRPAFPGVYAKLSKLSAWVKDCKENKEKCDAA